MALLESDAFAVTPSDTVNLAVAGQLYIGVTGDVKVTTIGGTDVVFKAVPVGWLGVIRVLRVWSTGTTATNIVAAN